MTMNDDEYTLTTEINYHKKYMTQSNKNSDITKFNYLFLQLSTDDDRHSA